MSPEFLIAIPLVLVVGLLIIFFLRRSRPVRKRSGTAFLSELKEAAPPARPMPSPIVTADGIATEKGRLADSPIPPAKSALPEKFAFQIIQSPDPEWQGQRIEVEGRIISVGRSPQSDLSIQGDDQISRRQAEMRYIDGQWHIVDQGSTYGTSLNGKQLKPGEQAAFQIDDMIGFGTKTTLQYVGPVSPTRSIPSLETAEIAPVGGFEDFEEDEHPLPDLDEGAPLDDFLLEDVVKKPVPPAPSLSKVHFTVYCPREVSTSRSYSLYTYAHLQQSDVIQKMQADIRKFEDELGGTVPKPKVTRDPVEVAQGVPITIVPECDRLTFDPVSLTKRWTGDLVRFGFDFRPNQADVDESLSIRLSIQIGAVEIAHLTCLTEVVKGEVEVPPIPPTMPLNNPLAEAKAKYHAQGVQPYQRIFISYSRQDTEIVEAFRFAQLALGNDVFMDTYSIPPGVDWRAYLAKAIDEAEIFQLFWSPNSAASENVRHEWEYALQQRCPDTRCVSFIRPMYWSKPLPQVPNALSHLNFRFIELKPKVASG